MITLVSNFGTFILYALSCILCIVAYHNRVHDHKRFLKHTLIPAFGLIANLWLHGGLPGPSRSSGSAPPSWSRMGQSPSQSCGACMGPSTS